MLILFYSVYNRLVHGTSGAARRRARNTLISPIFAIRLRVSQAMSDPARVEALVQAEIAATGKVARHGGGRRQAFGANASDETGGGDVGGSGSPRVPKPAGIYKVSRAVQRASPCTMSTSSVDEDDADGLRRAAVHFWRARMMVRLSSLYSDAAWDAQEKPRKFFIKHRGFGVSHGKRDLRTHRRMFLRCALASAERAAEMAPSSVECATLHASVLNLANVEDGKGATDAALAKACAACRDAIHLHRRWSVDPLREGYEVSILHSPGAEKAAVSGSGSPASQVDSLKQMALRTARLLKRRRGAWDVETNWVRETCGGEHGGENDAATEEMEAAAAVAAVHLDEVKHEDQEDAMGWNMWQSASILDYSLAALRAQRTNE